MSRSFKKTPISKDGGRSSKWGKNQANRKIRNYNDEIPKGGSYKKLYEQWNINDYITYWTEKDAIEGYYQKKDYYHRKGWDVDFNKRFGTLEQYLIRWRKEMKNK